MPLTINREILGRVKAVIAQTGRVNINMLYWAEVRGSTAADSVDEIRKLSLLGDCLTTACLGGLVCHLATPEEITLAAGIYDLYDNELQEPSLLGAALLIYGAEEKNELEEACLPLFSLAHWPPEDQNAYNASRTDAEKNMVVLRRMDDWSAEVEARQSTED
jgi:hypothetical protein